MSKRAVYKCRKCGFTWTEKPTERREMIAQGMYEWIPGSLLCPKKTEKQVCYGISLPIYTFTQGKDPCLMT